jgi:hypothetical protein
MQSTTRWCLNEASMSYGAYTFRLFPIGRVNLQVRPTGHNDSLLERMALFNNSDSPRQLGEEGNP